MPQEVTRLILILDARFGPTSGYDTLRDIFLQTCKELICASYIHCAARPALLVSLCVLTERHVRRVLDTLDCREGGPEVLHKLLTGFAEAATIAQPERITQNNNNSGVGYNVSQSNVLYRFICEELQRTRVIGSTTTTTGSTSQSVVHAEPFILFASAFLRYTTLFQLLTQICTVTMTGQLHAIAMDSTAIAVTEATIGAGGKLARTSLDPNDVQAALQRSLVSLLFKEDYSYSTTTTNSRMMNATVHEVPVVLKLTERSRVVCTAARTFLTLLPGPYTLVCHSASSSTQGNYPSASHVLYCGPNTTPALYAATTNTPSPSEVYRQQDTSNRCCVLSLMAVLAPQNVDETLLWGESWVITLNTQQQQDNTEYMNDNCDMRALWQAMYVTFQSDALLFRSEGKTSHEDVVGSGLCTSPFQISFPVTYYIGYFVDRTRLLLRVVIPPELRVRRVYDTERHTLTTTSVFEDELRSVRQALIAQYDPKHSGRALEDCLTHQLEQVALRLRPMTGMTVRLTRS